MFEDKMRQSRNPKFIIKDSIMTLSEGGVRNNLDPVLANLKEGGFGIDTVHVLICMQYCS